MIRILYFFVIGTIIFFIGKGYYNNAHIIYDYEKEKADNLFKKLLLKLNTPNKLKLMGIILMILGFAFFCSGLILIIKYFL